jgi:hypothetical protein
MATNANNVILFKDFDVSQVNFEALNRNVKNGKSVRITYGPQKQILRLQLPDVAIPFDIKQMPDDMHPGEFTYSFEAALNGYDEPGSRMHMVHEKLKQLDERILKECVDKSPEWLGERKDATVVNEFHKRLVRQNNPKYSPLLRIKAARVNAQGDMPKVFDKSNGNAPLAIDALTRGARAMLIITLPSVWLVNKNFGISVKLFQACVTSRPSSVSIDDFAFKDDDVLEDN